MSQTDYPYGFTEAWSSLGIIDKCLLDRMLTGDVGAGKFEAKDFRSWAFAEFVAGNRPLSKDLAVKLFELAMTDPVCRVGMAWQILCLPECPVEVFRLALVHFPFEWSATRRQVERHLERLGG